MSMDRRGGGVTDARGNGANRAVRDICAGCGSPADETAGVNVYCDAKGRPVHLLRLCPECAEMSATGSPEARMNLFERIGRSEAAFLVNPVLEEEMAVH